MPPTQAVIQFVMVTCYLDSQDYSVLTDPSLEALKFRKIKDTLLHMARTKQVRFAFSAAVISESTALAADTTHLAELKAELVSELCGSNALVSLDRLVKAEVNALAQKSGLRTDMVDPHGRWFPDIAIDEKPPDLWNSMHRLAGEEVKSMGLSRQERRARVRLLFKNGKPRTALIASLERQDPNDLAAELLKKYPMRPEYAEVMSRYALGHATEQEFSTAFMNSLLDPRWMMMWFTTQHALSSPIAALVRQPGRELGRLMRSLAEISVRWAASLKDDDIEADPTSKNGELALKWQQMQEQQLIAFIESVAIANGVEIGEHAPDHLRTYCPGMTACLGSLYSSVWANVGGGRKEEPSDSQAVDSLHALYAPYVQVFRADRFMTPHIQKQVLHAGTNVVSRLSHLVPVLEKRLC